ncbi:ferritin-like domain-containing protein, partial [Rhizobium ruizarguesonis]
PVFDAFRDCRVELADTEEMEVLIPRIAGKRGDIKYLEAEAHGAGTTIFTGDRSRQITSEDYYSGGGELFTVTDLKSALEAIDLIIEQGE